VPCAIVKGDKASFDAAGVTTWGPIDFVVLNVYAELAARPGRVLGMEEIEYQLARLRYQLVEITRDAGPRYEFVVDGAYRDLVYAALARYSIGDLTRVARAFAEEGLSIRSLPEILDRLAQYDTVPLERDSLLLFDDRIAEANASLKSHKPAQRHYEYCRKQLKSYLSYKHSWAENTIVAYLLEPPLESRAPRLAAAVRTGGPRSSAWEREAEVFRDAVWTELQFVGSGPMGQAILTTPAARAAVRALLAPELPDLPVLSYSELRPDLNVQPIARIGAA
jgi:type III secretion protein V